MSTDESNTYLVEYKDEYDTDEIGNRDEFSRDIGLEEGIFVADVFLDRN